MKKLISALLCITLLLSLSAAAFADGTMTITTTVPGASYTLNIPADVEVEYNATATEIGMLTVSDATGFAKGKNIVVTYTFSGEFTCPTTTTTIPYKLEYRHPEVGYGGYYIHSGDTTWFCGNAYGGVSPEMIGSYGSYPEAERITIAAADWGAAQPGDYSTTITYTSEIVQE